MNENITQFSVHKLEPQTNGWIFKWWLFDDGFLMVILETGSEDCSENADENRTHWPKLTCDSSEKRHKLTGLWVYTYISGYESYKWTYINHIIRYNISFPLKSIIKCKQNIRMSHSKILCKIWTGISQMYHRPSSYLRYSIIIIIISKFMKQYALRYE